jgi:hypothetical protein
VSRCDHREYGPADITVDKVGNPVIDSLFEGLGDEFRVSVPKEQKLFLIRGAREL